MPPTPPLAVPGWHRLAGLAAGLSLVLGLGACAPGLSPEGLRRCQPQKPGSRGSLPTWVREERCRWGIEQRLELERLQRRQAQARKSLAALGRCRRERPELERLAAVFRGGALELEQLRRQRFMPSEAQPLPPSPQLLAGLATYDQELEFDRFNHRLADWRDRQQQRASAWRWQWSQRLAAAERRQATAAAQLRRLDPALVSSGGEPVLQELELQRRLACREPRA